ncbi:MAG: extracellular solute-binding protein [Treponema sp.]|nr:extracellular solute-binding protein [Treponema sp.]
MNRTVDMKKIDLMLLILALILLAAGFLFVRLMRIAPGAQKKEKNTKLVFTQWWEDELEEGTLLALAEEFEALHPGVAIQLDNRPYAEILSGLRSPGESSLAPDVVGLDPFWFEDLVRRDILEELDPWESTENLPMDLPDGSDQGYEKWGRHLISFINPLYYNIALLRDAGFDRPPKSRVEMLAYARRVTDAGAGRYALAMALGPENPRGVYRDIFSWIWALSPRTFRESRPDFSARSIAGTLDFLRELRQEGCLVPGTFAKTEAEKREDFIQGRVAMMIASVADIHLLRQRMGEGVFGITVIPGESSFEGKPLLGLTSWSLGIPRSAARKEEARAFLAFLLERGPLIAEKARAVPGSLNRTVDFSAGDPLYAKAYDIYTAGETVQELWGVSGADQFEALVREQLYALFEEGRTPEETAEQIQQQWEKL